MLDRKNELGGSGSPEMAGIENEWRNFGLSLSILNWLDVECRKDVGNVVKQRRHGKMNTGARSACSISAHLRLLIQRYPHRLPKPKQNDVGSGSAEYPFVPS